MITKGRLARKKRVRARVLGTHARPRLSVYRSNIYIYAQLVDDIKAMTLAEAHGKDAKAVGTEIAKKAITAKIKEAIFDRNGYKYHGKVKTLADAAREGGLKF